jgi:hypothetical protein
MRLSLARSASRSSSFSPVRSYINESPISTCRQAGSKDYGQREKAPVAGENARPGSNPVLRAGTGWFTTPLLSWWCSRYVTAAVPLTLGDFVLHDTLGREWEGELRAFYTLVARLHEFMYARSLLCRLCCALCRDAFGHQGGQKHRSKMREHGARILVSLR